MALNKLKFNSLNVTAAAGKTVGFNSNADGLEATFEGGSMRLIKKLTASSSGTLSFVDGASDVVLDNTYREYMFIFKNIHPQTNSVNFEFNMSTDSGSNYDVAKVTTTYYGVHGEDGSDGALDYSGARDLAGGTGFQNLNTAGNISNDNDHEISGYLHLFNPSTTTFTKHFICHNSAISHDDYNQNNFVAGFGNTTSAVDAIQFKMSSGNIDSGTITLYGIN